MPRLKNSSYDIGGKLCSKCRRWKPVTDFNKRKTSIDGFDNWCRTCNKESCKKYNDSNLGKNKQYRRYIEKYGITVERYNELLAKQKGVCAICAKPEKYFSRLVIDHDHNTGKVRGLLCNHCNRGLGFLGDSLDTVLSAARYLNESGKNE